MKKLFVVLSLMLVFSFVFAACGAPAQETAAPAAEEAAPAAEEAAPAEEMPAEEAPVEEEMPAEPVSVRVSSKSFTEQYVLGNMYQLLLENAGFEVEYSPLAGTSELHQALLNNEIDIYPEYTGTGFMTVLEGAYDPSMTSDDVYSAVSDGYKPLGLEWGKQTQFNNTYCLTMTQDKATELGVVTLSDLSAKAGELVFGTTQEFTERADGLPGLQEMYGGFQFADVVALDPGLLYSGISNGDIDVTTCFGTDGQISAYNLLVLEDDKGFWPPYPVGPVVRAELADANPLILETLDQLAPLLDGDTMSGLNWEVAGNGREADEVAREFLVSNGLISE